MFVAYVSKSAARKACKRGEVLLNGEEARGAVFVKTGDWISRREATGALPKVFPLDLSVVYEDRHMAVVLKPPGFRVNGNIHRTVEHALPHNLTLSDAPDALRQFRPVHRLDAPTGGLLVCAKSARALMSLGRIFQERRVRKTYVAVLIGRLEGDGLVSLPIDGRDASSSYRVIEHCRSLRTQWTTTVELQPHTGRTHQLRKHMSSLGHPVLGDALYGRPGSILRGKGLFLWAVGLQLPHPISGESMDLVTPQPPKFEQFRRRERRRWLKYFDHDPEETS